MSVFDTMLGLSGTLSSGGDMQGDDRKVADGILRTYARTVQSVARELRLAASSVKVLRASFALVAKDSVTFKVVLASGSLGTPTISYRDLARYGPYVPVRDLIESVRVEVGDPIAAFELPGGFSDALIESIARAHVVDLQRSQSAMTELRSFPPELLPSIEAFRKDHPPGKRTAFIMMRFGSTPVHDAITSVIREALQPWGITALRADDKRYSDDLWANVRTYMHASEFGLAVFERIERDDFNPNLSLELGYMMGLNKPVCLLKDRSLTALHSDIVGRLYETFDTHHLQGTLPKVISNWLREKELIKPVG